MWTYRCKIKRVVDGDTVDVDIDLGFSVWLKKQRIRLYGIDTPESRTRDKEEKVFGILAKEFLKRELDSESVRLKTRKDGKGKYGRILGEFIKRDNDGHPVYGYDININNLLVEKHHAVAYHGQSKEDIAEQHLANRKHHNVGE